MTIKRTVPSYFCRINTKSSTGNSNNPQIHIIENRQPKSRGDPSLVLIRPTPLCLIASWLHLWPVTHTPPLHYKYFRGPTHPRQYSQVRKKIKSLLCKGLGPPQDGKLCHFRAFERFQTEHPCLRLGPRFAQGPHKDGVLSSRGPRKYGNANAPPPHTHTQTLKILRTSVLCSSLVKIICVKQ